MADAHILSEPATTSGVAFGLVVRSTLRLPELLPASDAAAADVEVSFGPVPMDLPDAQASGVRYQAAPGRLLLRVDGVARYLVSGGRTIAISREPGADDDEVRAFLLGPVIGALLHQRDDLVLHGSAVAIQGEAVAFIGGSGVGKSTTAAAFRSRGYPVLTDDLCVVRPQADGRMAISPAFPQAKLWLDSLKQLAISPDGLRRLRHKIEKRVVPLGEAFAREPLPIKKLFVLVPSNQTELSLKPVEGPRKFKLLKEHTYRFGFLAGVGERAGHFQQALKLAQQVPIALALRPDEGFRLDELLALIEADLRS